MPLRSLPLDVLDNILFFVSPPLPVPTSSSTVLDDILQERDDFRGQLELRDLGSMMRVSKRLKVSSF